MTKPKSPNWMLKTPQPQEEVRILSGVPMKGWLGLVPLENIRAYVGNRRTDLQVTLLKKRLGLRVPTDEELFEFLGDDPDLDIERLAENIILNGLRIPLVLTHDRILLDGNRRYFAHRWIALNGDTKIKPRFEKVKAWVLFEEFSDLRNQLRVVTEYNYLDDQRRQWKDYVKAKLLYDEYNDSKKNPTYETLTELYGGHGFGKGKIIEFIKTFEIIEEFVRQAPDEDAARASAYENFIWFQQLQRANRDEIRNDNEFQKVVFDNIRNERIERTDQLKNLRSLYKYKDAWALFKKGDIEKGAIDRAHDLRRFHEQDEKDNPDPDLQLTEINVRLKALCKERGKLERLSEEQLTEFHDLAEKIPGQVADIALRIDYILDRLAAISSSELADLPSPSFRKIKQALERVIRQAESTR